jgi:hypothetical protein
MKASLLSLSCLVFVAVVATTLEPSPARAQEYPWCAMSCPGGGGPMCTYTTLDQCRASLVGGSGYCEPNPRANASPATFKRTQR